MNKLKVTAAFLAFVMCMGLTACGNNNSSSDEVNSKSQQSESADGGDSGDVDVSDISLTDATGKIFTVGVADGWKLVTAEEAGSMMEAEFLVKGTAFDAMGTYIQISQTTGNIDEWVEQTKNDTYIKYDGEYTINGIKWYCADKVAGAEIDGKIVTAYPQNGADLQDKSVQAMLGSIRWAN